MQKEFKDAVFEFTKEASDFDSVRTILLFGSVAKGEADKRSDIDILVIFDAAGNKFKDEDKIFTMSQELGKKYDKTVQVVFSNRNFDKLDRKFIETVLKESIILYGKLPSVKADNLLLEPYSIFSFDLDSLDKNNRNKLGRILMGYATKKKYKSKVYKSSSEGLIKGYGCRKLGPSSIIVPFKNINIFEKLFKSFNIKYRKLDVWISRI